MFIYPARELINLRETLVLHIDKGKVKEMRCGTECFIATVEVNNKIKEIRVPARSNPDARKMIRRKYGTRTKVLRLKREI